MSEVRRATVAELQAEGILLVEDGNHGESRPRPDEFVDSGVAFVRAADMDAGRVLFETASRINDRARQRITKGIGAPGDILLSHKGTVGKVAIVQGDAPPFVCSPQTTFWRTLRTDVLDRHYLYAYLRSAQFHRQLASRAGETDMAPYVSLTAQRQLVVVLPPIAEQRRIAAILGALDEKIELNRRIAASIEVLTRTIFEARFVEPATRHEVDWPEVGLDSLGEFLNGLALQKYPADGSGFLPVIKIAQLHSGDVSGADQASLDVPARYVVNDGDLLFSWSGSLECVLWSGGNGALNQHLFKVTPRGVPQWFLYFWIHRHLDAFRGIAAGKATTMGHIQRHHLSEARVPMPPHESLKEADRLVAPMFDAIVHRLVENRTIISLRDLMLPRLLSPQAEVPV
ncbi:MAG: restriction endonuclease subunit S [Chloroflexi bacterium]|nr:restriction endonuclease subunit S [Chloroflexota bacterium]